MYTSQCPYFVMKNLIPLFACYFIGVMGLPYSSQAQNPANNQQVIVDETVQMLQGSSVIRSLEKSFVLETDYPQKLRYALIDPLLEMNKSVVLEQGAAQKLFLEVHSNNSFIRLSRRNAERRIQGEFILYLSDENDVISQTGHYPFSYIDTVSVSDKDMLDSGSWPAARFHQEKDGSRRSFISRVAEPVVLLGATAVTVFLLYNVRR